MRQKRIGQKGGLTLPADIRRDIGLDGGDGIDIEVDAAGKIIISKHTPTCIFCHEYATKKYKGREICDKCIQAIGKGDF